MTNNCKGCLIDTTRTFMDEDGTCDTYKFNYDGECPCTECIVKVMCEGSCNDYEYFRREKQSHKSL
jgi:hypothetical protein